MTLNPACASARNLADDSVCRNGVKLPEEEVNRRIAVIKDGVSKGKETKVIAYELDMKAKALQKFMKQNGFPKRERKSSAAALAVMADIKTNGQNNRTHQEIAVEARIPLTTVNDIVKRLKRDDDSFTWAQGGVNQKTLTSRQIFDGAIDNGKVRAS